MSFKSFSTAPRNAAGAASGATPESSPAGVLRASQPMQQQPATAHPGAAPVDKLADKPANKPVAPAPAAAKP